MVDGLRDIRTDTQAGRQGEIKRQIVTQRKGQRRSIKHTSEKLTVVGVCGALVESTPLVRRVMGSTYALAWRTLY